GRARSAIRRRIRLSERGEFQRLGREAVEHIFAKAGKTLAGVSLRPALDRFAAGADGDLFQEIGRGRISPQQILEAVFPGLAESEKAAALARTRIEIDASAVHFRGGGVAPGDKLRLSPCCGPVPGDRIVGIAEPDGTIAVHTVDCARLAEFETEQERWRDLQWTPEAERNSLCETRLHATIRDAPGVLGQACTIIGEAGGNIIGVNMRHRHTDFFDVDFDVEVKDARHLTQIAAGLRACPSIMTVDRFQG
ncbi:MAG: bifunctional (p)ppGpp synthetase/guanosine-3',5'-bis(diphosphate) 3'-pyrophosphohydrolase, partial [Alphaproteobacteria bacterium]|nr:bifunctional (p)ppGpp synthetase/guanosine-3',5'-bis(diphosphate) 3'-pyrophosphohydrolase [Alphaproteobacteria bacterium]